MYWLGLATNTKPRVCPFDVWLSFLTVSSTPYLVAAVRGVPPCWVGASQVEQRTRGDRVVHSGVCQVHRVRGIGGIVLVA